MSGPGPKYTWTTRDELGFIQEIGSNPIPPCSDGLVLARMRGRRSMLEGYLQGAWVRSRWGKVDRTRAISMAQEELKRCGSQTDQDTSLGLSALVVDTSSTIQGTQATGSPESEPTFPSQPEPLSTQD